jgi:hypothetical protein
LPPYQLKISKECKYTIAAVKYNNYDIVPQSGYNGSVVLFKEPGSKLKICGVGHVNGGEEKILSFSLKADGRVIQPEEGQSYSAESFELKKISMLANIKLFSTIIISKNGIVDKRSIEAEKEQKLLFLYLYMYCFSPKTKEWTAYLANGSAMSGTFKDKNAFQLNRDIKWLAMFDPGADIGVIAYYPTAVKGKNKKSTLWDKAHYHKYYFILNTPPVIPEGYKLNEKTLIVKCFEADKKNWQEIAKNIVKSLDTAKQ